MHELSIAYDIMRILENALGEVKPISTVNLTIGPLSGISPDALRFCFTEVALAEGFGKPELAISEPPAKLICLDCEKGYTTDDFYKGCPHCMSLNRRILTGREFTVDSVEIDEGED